MPLSAEDVYLGLLVLPAALVPLGLVLLRAGERLVQRRVGLSIPERLLLALLAAGSLLFVIASVPAGVYGPWAIDGLLVLGVVVLAFLWYRDRGASLRAGLRWLSSWPAVTVTSLFLLVLGLEVVGAGTAPYPNTYDGSFQLLFAHLTLLHGSTPWTLEPYSATGVAYPQAAAVWLTLPVLLLGWPLLSTPVTLPLLFLSLGVPGAFCFGERAVGLGTGSGRVAGVVFAAFFALVASWPRLFIGGSYDFVIALPFFLVALGGLRSYAIASRDDWRLTLAFGVFAGAVAGISAAIGETLLLLILAFYLAFLPWSRAAIARWVPRFLAVCAFAAAFAVRSLVAVAVWWGYPEHVLTPIGSPPYATTSGLPVDTLSALIGDIDPFTPFKLKLSPLPILSVLLVVLLVIGLALLVLDLLAPRTGVAVGLPPHLSASVAVATLVALLWTVVLRVASTSGFGFSVLDNVASLYEASFVLFLFYSVIALLPLVAAAQILRADLGSESAERPSPDGRSTDRSSRGWRAVSPNPSRLPVVVAFALLLVPLGLGGAVTLTEVPGYLGGHLQAYANVSAADTSGLAWAADNLPACSRVLVAPGSAAMFLPLFARVQLDFPMLPVPVNLSYVDAVEDLTQGTFTHATSTDLVELGITVVFVTGQNSISYLPFQRAVFTVSNGFEPLFSDGDAALYAFGPGEAEIGCSG